MGMHLLPYKITLEQLVTPFFLPSRQELGAAMPANLHPPDPGGQLLHQDGNVCPREKIYKVLPLHLVQALAANIHCPVDSIAALDKRMCTIGSIGLWSVFYFHCMKSLSARCANIH